MHRSSSVCVSESLISNVIEASLRPVEDQSVSFCLLFMCLLADPCLSRLCVCLGRSHGGPALLSVLGLMSRLVILLKRICSFSGNCQK